ncbi:TPA: hypothetical protein ACT2GF_002201 [Pasteurella multocida]|uniref:hypothetical protein n=1 Tax=Pasteurella multocida TaxID=747 RepID=UPI00397988C4
MKKMSRASQAMSFIAGAANGEITDKKTAKAKKYNSVGSSTVNFSDAQGKLIKKLLEITNISTTMTLFSAAAQYMKEGIDNSDYMDYIPFLIGDKSNYRFTMNKNGTYLYFREKYEEYKDNWVNIRLRGVITLSLLHYAKNKLNLDLGDLLSSIKDKS